MTYSITAARSDAEMGIVAGLFEAYVRALGRDIAYQDVEAERRALPGAYAPPGGELLLALLTDGTPAGCVALRPIAPAGCCEMKRLFVTAPARGMGIGRALIDAIIEVAGARGYRDMWLDSLADLTSALALYGAAGFTPIAAYNDNPFADAIFLGRPIEPR